MNRKTLLAAAATAAVAGSLLLAPSAQAVTEHCDSSLFPNKVELSGDDATVDTGLAPGTSVCIKAGTQTVIVTVASDGTISTEGLIVNNQGNARGISYYAFGEGPPSS